MENEDFITHNFTIKRENREERNRQKSVILWFTGLSGSGKSTLCNRVEERLFQDGFKTITLDADNIRLGLNKDLGFSDSDRLENMRRVAEVAKLFLESGTIVLCTFISPKTAERELVKSIVGRENFIEIFVNCPLEECEKRDVKGVYSRFRRGEIKNFIGIDVEYEIPKNPNIQINTHELNVSESVDEIIDIILPKIKYNSMENYNITYLKELEAEAIYIIRESIMQFERNVLLFSGGKDSLVLLHLAKKAFFPAKIPFPIMHIDTGHNFPETLRFRDKIIKELGVNLIVRKVQDSIDNGRVTEEIGINASRNTLQTTTLLDAISEFNFDAAICGGRRDEEKARAKERIFSHRDEFGQWEPKNQRPELWNIFNGQKKIGEHFRIFPLSNWTELDVWQYILMENLKIPELYFSHKRKCIERNGVILPCCEFNRLKDDESIKEMNVRFRTVGDMTCSGAVVSEAENVSDIINEICLSKMGERGGRYDDKKSDCSMEERKREGYF